MKLTNTSIKNLKSTDKRYKVSDGDSLYIAVEVSGRKTWELIYNNAEGRRTSKVLGKYPQMSLKEARLKRDKVKHGVGNTACTFGELLNEYLDTKRSEFSEQYIKDSEGYFKNHLYNLEKIALVDISNADIVEGFKRMQRKGITEGIRKAAGLLDRIFKYGVTVGRMSSSPMRDIDASLFVRKREVKQYAHITDPEVLKALLCAINTVKGITPVMRASMLFAVHAFVRPSNIRYMLKSEVDFEQGLWTIPAEKMKTSKDHVVPLTPQMQAILKGVWDNGSDYVFPSPNSRFKPMSENTLNNGLQRLGVCEITAHGLRHTASTFLNEAGLFRPDVIELQLAHVDKNVIRGTYNKAVYLKERSAMMQWWSNFLEVDCVKEL